MMLSGVTIRSTKGIDEALTAWRGIASEQLIGAGLLAVVATLPTWYELLMNTLLSNLLLVTAVPTAIQLLAINLVRAYTLLLAIVITDRAVDRGRSRLGAYAMAVMVGVLVGTVLSWTVKTQALDRIIPDAGYAGQKFKANPRMIVTIGVASWLEWITLGALATFVYADRREVRKLAATLKATQDERLARVRQQIESDLLAMQARVEPQFLFDTLGEIQDLYETDPARAERILNSLIDFLRAAMPPVRDTRSTLEQEIQVAFAYVSIQSMRAGVMTECRSEVQDTLRTARVPAMTLLPLLDQAVKMLGESERDPGQIVVRAAVSGERLAITIDAQGNCFGAPTTSSNVPALRDRLVALYAGAAETSVSRTSAQSAQAVLAIPLEIAYRHGQ